MAFIILQIVNVIRTVQPHSNVTMMENARAKKVLTDVSARYVPIPSTDILTAEPVDVMMKDPRTTTVTRKTAIALAKKDLLETNVTR